jgi:hydrogenase maturation protein HypF
MPAKSHASGRGTALDTSDITVMGRVQFDQPAAGEGRRIEIRGTVQGVGFRPWVYRIARETAVSGRVCNHTGGVTVDAFGPPDALRAFVARLSTTAPAAAVIDEIDTSAIPFEPVADFTIVESRLQNDRRVSIPPDLATCADCEREIADPFDRRFEYAFTNCTSCGPRFTIATSAPYDRPNTTMAPFVMCPSCRREYDSVEDRRFHAQPNACPLCGPSLALVDGTGRRVASAGALEEATKALRTGLIVAIKGLGGFHLACDATSPVAVERLRQRKQRDEKPFAVMVKDIDAAHALAVLTDAEERLLLSTERPIVLVPRREPTALAGAVAPNLPLLGLFLPGTPLHHLVMRAVRRPLVMTSGNLADEPIAYANEEAVHRLREVADLFLVHDRDIVTRCDDSVARVIAGSPVVLRRSRGYVPRPIALAARVPVPVLACGALLKNTFCIARGREAVLGPHIGDLENLETYRSYRESIERFERFLDVTPGIVAHDLHPDYLSTRYALARPGVTTVAVQHHHAHVVSVMAEHGLDGRVIGVAYDGTGLGTDGTAWGGEILIADDRQFERAATFRPIALAGGDAAIRQPWRVALALLDEAFDGNPPLGALQLFRRVPAAEIDVVRQMIRHRLNAPLAHGVGRYFDAMGAIGLGRPRAAYEGQIALEWNVAAADGESGRYRYDVVRAEPWELDLRPMVRDAVIELIGGEPAARVSARFHNTLAAATAELVRGVSRTVGALPVALSGGCFQNARLTESVLRELTPEFAVYTHGSVPPGDGGIALGQAVIAGRTCDVPRST